MHDTMKRLYQAAKLLRNIDGPSALANFLNQSPQLINNWERRGMSKGGMLDAQEKIGCSATWLATGDPPMTVAAAVSVSANHKSGQSDSSKRGTQSTVIEPSVSDAARTLDVSTLSASQRVRATISPMGVTSRVLADVAGVSEETAAQWLNEGSGPELTLAQAVALQEAYGVNAVWLLKGKGEAGVAIRYDDEYRPIPITNWKPIPVVGMAQLGDNGHWSDLEYPVGVGDGYIDFPSHDPDAYALKCVGDSMRPRIRDGEFVIVEPGHPIEPGDDVLVKSKDGRVMVKTYLYTRAGRVHLVSVNEAHPSMALQEDEIEKMHYVAATARPSMWRRG